MAESSICIYFETNEIKKRLENETFKFRQNILYVFMITQTVKIWIPTVYIPIPHFQAIKRKKINENKNLRDLRKEFYYTLNSIK